MAFQNVMVGAFVKKTEIFEKYGTNQINLQARFL